MGKRRKGKRRVAEPTGYQPTGIALLLSEMAVEKLDLHGLTARTATHRVRLMLERRAGSDPGSVVHVVTGKGSRSAGAAVLPGAVRDVLEGEGARYVREYAGLPGGGGFSVRLVKRRPSPNAE